MRQRDSVLSWKGILLAWSIPAALSIFEAVSLSRMGPRPVPLWQAVLSGAPPWYTWAALTPLLAWHARRNPLRRSMPWRAIARHVGLALACAVLVSAVSLASYLAIRPLSTPLGVLYSGWFVNGLPGNVIAYAGATGICQWLMTSARLQAQERDTAQLAAQLTDAQLHTLRAQLQPHFLFNSLNAVMALVRDGERASAIQALDHLSELLRTAMQTPTHQVPLEEELTFVRRYLSVEQLRYGDRLRVTWDVDPGVHSVLVPAFVLQPLVENALKHGVARRRRGGDVTISAKTEGSQLLLTVTNDPADVPATSVPGVGLANLKARLQQLHGAAASLTLSDRTDHGVVVATVRLNRQGT